MPFAFTPRRHRQRKSKIWPSCNAWAIVCMKVNSGVSHTYTHTNYFPWRKENPGNIGRNFKASCSVKAIERPSGRRKVHRQVQRNGEAPNPAATAPKIGGTGSGKDVICIVSLLCSVEASWLFVFLGWLFHYGLHFVHGKASRQGIQIYCPVQWYFV